MNRSVPRSLLASGSSLGDSKDPAKKFVGPLIGARLGKKRPVLPLTGLPAKVLRLQQIDETDADSATDPDKAADLVEEEEDDDGLEGQGARDLEERPSAEAVPKEACSKDTAKDPEQKPDKATSVEPTEVKDHLPVKFQQVNSSRRRIIGPTLPPSMMKAVADAVSDADSDRKDGPAKKKPPRIRECSYAEMFPQPDLFHVNADNAEVWSGSRSTDIN